MRWAKLTAVLVFVFWVSTATSKSSKCSKLVSKIPVHKNFDIDKFLGTWYTVTRTTWAWGENTYKSSSIVIARNPDDTISYSSTGKLGDVCAPVETGTLKPGKRLGEFTMKSPLATDPRMIVSFTDYNTALIYYCFKFRGNRNSVCKLDGSQVEVMSRTVKPKKKDVTAYINRAGKRLCVDAIELFATTPGQCKVPDIMEAARKGMVGVGNSESGGTSFGECVVDDVPVQKDFELSMMSGTWYEIARTRNTFNKMESVVTHYDFDEQSGQLISYYTGTTSSASDTDHQCQAPVKSTTKLRHPDGAKGDLLGRIGGEDSAYPWSPLKILYADDKYIMVYACYSGQTKEPCKQEGSEVIILGKSRDLDTETRDKMYALLPSVCFQQSELLETSFLANCSSHASQDMTKKEITPSDCYLDSIPVYDDYTKEALNGNWYLYAYIHFNSSAFLSGVVMSEIMSDEQPVEPMETVILSFDGVSDTGEQICKRDRTRSRERCLDTADQITTLPFLDGSNFVFSKILHLSDSLLIKYICTKETVDGRCELDGILFNAYKNISMEETDDDELEMEIIYNMARSACLDPDLLEFETEWCSADLLDNVNGSTEMADDDVDSLTIYSDYEDFHQEDLYGYWYLIARSNASNELEDLEALVAYFTADTNASLVIYYTGRPDGSDNSTCSEVKLASLVARCIQESNGDYLIRYKVTDDYVLYAPFKVLHLEKENVLVTYVCQHMLQNGRCNASEAQVRIWGRNSTIDEDTREMALEMMYWAYVDPMQEGYIVDVNQNESLSCDKELKEYIATNHIGVVAVEIDLENASDGDGEGEEKEQKDQRKKKDDDDDLEAELLMDDDEFYYGT